MKIVGKLLSKMTVDRANIELVRRSVRTSGCGDPGDLHVGDNVYSILTKDATGSTVKKLSTRNYIVKFLKSGHIIDGLKLSVDGRLIEDAARVEAKTAAKLSKSVSPEEFIKKVMLDEVKKRGVFTYHFDSSDTELGQIEQAAKKMNGEDSDIWEIAASIKKIGRSLAEEKGFLTGGSFWSDEVDEFILGTPETFIRCLGESVLGTIGNNEELDEGLPKKMGERTIKEYGCREDIAAEHGFERLPLTPDIWMLSGVVRGTYCRPYDLEDYCELILSNTVGTECEYDALGAYLDFNAAKAVNDTYNKIRSSRSTNRSIGVLFEHLKRNVQCLLEMGYRCKDPDETLQDYVKALEVEDYVYSETFSDYIGLVTAIYGTACRHSGHVILDNTIQPYAVEDRTGWAVANHVLGMNMAANVLELPDVSIKVAIIPGTLVISKLGVDHSRIDLTKLKAPCSAIVTDRNEVTGDYKYLGLINYDGVKWTVKAGSKLHGNIFRPSKRQVEFDRFVGLIEAGYIKDFVVTKDIPCKNFAEAHAIVACSYEVDDTYIPKR